MKTRTPACAAPALMLRFKKRKDAGVAFTCVRTDGSWTSAPIGPERGYGPIHDMAHYVAETALGLTGGFLGLLARGWAIDDFEVGALEKIAREPDSRDAGVAEGIAGLLSGEEMMGRHSSVDDFNRTLASNYDGTGVEPPVVTAEQLAGMREALA